MSDAYQLVHGFSAVHAALSSGQITAAHVRVILEHGTPVEPGPARDTYVERALPLARAESPNRLRGMLARVAEEVRDIGITERHHEARRARAVWVTDAPDGMATLHALLPSVLAHGVKDRLDQMAHTLRTTNKTDARNRANDDTAINPSATATATATSWARAGSTSTGTRTGIGRGANAGTHTGRGTGSSPGEGAGAGASEDANEREGEGAGAGAGAGADERYDARTVDQIRADLLADLLLTSIPNSVNTAIGSIRATVAVTIPVLTLLGEESTGAELDGITPIDADTARLLAGARPGWDRVLTHPISGGVLATDRYRPTADMRRFLTHRDQHCRHPGCRVPIRYTDIDHNHDWAHGGTTTITNLAPLCRRHHSLKTHAGWKIAPRSDGTIEFITPAGRHYPQHGHHAVAFTPGPATDQPPW